MMKTKIAIPFVLIAVVILLAGNADVYGTGGNPNPWGINYTPPKGTGWTGTLVVTGQIVDVPGLPAGLPADATPADPQVYKDQIVKMEFFVTLENKKNPPTTFSGLAKDKEGYYLFYALGDFFNSPSVGEPSRIGEALNKFLKDKVYPNLPGGPYNGALTGLTEQSTNVGSQLQYGLEAETPLYYSAKIAIVTW
jgi:hypothetical protein